MSGIETLSTRKIKYSVPNENDYDSPVTDFLLQDEWVDVKNELPSKPGWYKVRTKYSNDESEVPYSTTLSGQLVWVLPDPSIITHWGKNKYNPK